MKKHRHPGIALVCTAMCGATAALAGQVTKFADDLHDAPGYIIFTGVIYRPGMKITRLDACNDGGYPYGSFAIQHNEDHDFPAALGERYLDGGAALQDFCGLPWQVEFDMPVKSFSATCYDVPGGYWPSTDVCRVRVFDINGKQLGESHYKRAPEDPTVTVLTVKTVDGSSTIYRAELSYQTNAPYNRPYPFPTFMNWGMLTWESAPQ